MKAENNATHEQKLAADKAAEREIENLDAVKLARHTLSVLGFVTGAISQIPDDELKRMMEKNGMPEAYIPTALMLIQYAKVFLNCTSKILSMDDEQIRIKTTSEVAHMACIVLTEMENAGKKHKKNSKKGNSK